MIKRDSICDCNAINYDSCEKARKALLEDKCFYKIEEFFKTYADSTRLKIICVLDSQERLCVCDIACALNMTKSAISHQLRYLKENNLVMQNKVGKEVYYSLIDDHVKDIYEIGLNHIKENF